MSLMSLGALWNMCHVCYHAHGCAHAYACRLERHARWGPEADAATVHAEEASKRLASAGFEKLSERQPWKGLRAGGKYYFTRNASTLVAFAVGARYQAGNGFHMVGAHTDRCACHPCACGTNVLLTSAVAAQPPVMWTHVSRKTVQPVRRRAASGSMNTACLPGVQPEASSIWHISAWLSVSYIYYTGY